MKDAQRYTKWIKSVSWKYGCDEQYLEESNKGKC